MAQLRLSPNSRPVSRDSLVGVYTSFTQSIVIIHSQASGYATAHSLDTNKMDT